MRVDSLVVLGLALALGSASFTSPAVAALLLVALAALGGSRALGRAGLLLLLLAFAFGAASSRIRVQHWDSSWHRARAALREPARCAGEARVVSSPTRHSGVTSFSAELEALDCEGRALPALPRAPVTGVLRSRGAPCIVESSPWPERLSVRHRRGRTARRAAARSVARAAPAPGADRPGYAAAGPSSAASRRPAPAERHLAVPARHRAPVGRGPGTTSQRRRPHPRAAPAAQQRAHPPG